MAGMFDDVPVVVAPVQTAPQGAPVTSQPLPNVPGYVSQPGYQPPANGTPTAWQAPAVPLGGPGAGGMFSDVPMAGQAGSGGGDARPTSEGLGFMEGVAKPLARLQGAEDQTLGQIPLVGSLFHSTPTAQAALAGMKSYFANQEKSETPGLIGKAAGGFVGTLPTLAMGPLAAGAASGALLSDATTPLGTAKDALIGALAGKGADLGVTALQKVISPAVRPAAQWAADHGIGLGPGSILGGVFQKGEDALSKFALAGPVVRGAQTRTLKDFNIATLNRGLQPAGLSLPAGVEAGFPAIDAAHDAYSTAYNTLLPKLSVQADTPLLTDIASSETAGKALDGPYAARMKDIIDNKVLPAFSPQTGAMSGTDLQNLSSYLGLQARRFGKSPDPFAQEYADAVTDLRGSLHEAVQRSNPAEAPQLAALDNGFAQLVRVDKAGVTAAQRGGIFTPSDLISADRSLDSSGRNTATARGRGLMQDWANQAKDVVPATMPPNGSWLSHIPEAIVTWGVGHENGMHGLGAMAALEAAIGGAYSKTGQKVMTPLLTQRPAAAAPLADSLDALRLPLRGIAPVLAVGSRPGP